MALEHLDIHMQEKEKKGTDLTCFTKINSKWTTDQNVKCSTIKLLEDNIREKLDYLGYGNDFLNRIPKGHSMKTQNWQAGLN